MQPEEVDLNAYFLGEGTPAERAAAEALLASTPEAREDAERLQSTLAALRSLPQEEIPRRIAFVSDPVFQPSWWQRFWQSTPQLGFASAAMLAVAIGAHGWFTRPLPVVATAAPVAQVQTVATVSQQDIDAAVAKAVAAVEARQQAATEQKVQVAIKDYEKRLQMEMRMMAASYEENQNYIRKQMNRMIVQNAGLVVESPTRQ